MQVLYRGNPVIVHGSGSVGPTGRRPISSRTVFDIGSVAKQFTATAILKLEEEGRLRVTDSLSRFFPDIPNDKRGITVHTLLTHTSGLRRDYSSPMEFVTRDSMFRTAMREPLESRPGARFEYSNPGYVILGLIVERLVDRPLEEHLARTIWIPYRMTQTGFLRPRWDRSIVAQGIGPLAFPGSSLDLPRSARAVRPGLPVSPAVRYLGAGAVLSTADDMAQWARALTSGSVLGAVGLQKLFGRYADATPSQAYGYGWFVRTSPSGTPWFSHHGNYGAYLAELSLFPTDSVAIVMLTNGQSDAANFIRAQLPTVLFGGPMPVLPHSTGAPPSAAARAGVIGEYVLPGGHEFSIVADGAQLRARTPDVRASAAMTRWPAARLVRDSALLTRAQHIVQSLLQGNAEPLRAVSPAQPPFAEVQQFFARRANAWSESYGALRSVEILSGLRRAATTDTYLAAIFARGTVMIRAEQDSAGRLVVNANPPTILSDAHHLVLAGDSVMTFNFALGTAAHGVLERGAAGRVDAIVWQAPSGEPLRALRKTSRVPIRRREPTTTTLSDPRTQ
ncbi:MAG: serine hydrolase domain-containing protein [Gemmatimonadota bacterium]